MSFLNGDKHGKDEGLFLRSANSAVELLVGCLGCLVVILILSAIVGLFISLAE